MRDALKRIIWIMFRPSPEFAFAAWVIGCGLAVYENRPELFLAFGIMSVIAASAICYGWHKS